MLKQKFMRSLVAVSISYAINQSLAGQVIISDADYTNEGFNGNNLQTNGTNTQFTNSGFISGKLEVNDNKNTGIIVNKGNMGTDKTDVVISFQGATNRELVNVGVMNSSNAILDGINNGGASPIKILEPI